MSAFGLTSALLALLGAASLQAEESTVEAIDAEPKRGCVPKFADRMELERFGAFKLWVVSSSDTQNLFQLNRRNNVCGVLFFNQPTGGYPHLREFSFELNLGKGSSEIQERLEPKFASCFSLPNRGGLGACWEKKRKRIFDQFVSVYFTPLGSEISGSAAFACAKFGSFGEKGQIQRK